MTSQSSLPETINRLIDNTTYALAMVAGMQLDVWTPLKDGPLAIEQMAASLNIRAEKLRPLLHALAAAKLLAMDGGQFSSTPEAQRYLVGGGPDSMLGEARQLTHLWTELLGTTESIRTGVPQSMVDYSESTEQQILARHDRMYPRAESATRRLHERYDFSSFRRLADVGGAHGALAITMTEVCPDLKATVIDLPSVIPFTQRYIERAGAGDRVDVQEADAVAGPLTGSFDLAVLKNFIQVLTTEQARKALINIARVIEPGGAIYIWGAGILDDSLVSPAAAVRYGLSTVNRLDGTQASTEKAHREWLTDAGFERVTRDVLPDGESVIMARRPA